MAPVVRRAQDGERELLELSWGFVLPHPARPPRRMTNTRDAAFWRDPLVVTISHSLGKEEVVGRLQPALG